MTANPDPIKVALLTHAGGAHVSAYLNALRDTESCNQVVIADPDDRFPKQAREVLGDKLTAVYRDVDRLLLDERPAMSLVTMEAKLAPPVVNAALEADSHVFAEKPACVRAEDFAPLVAKADSKHRYLMLALANRTNPEIAAAKRLVESGAIGKIYGVDMHLIADQTRLTREGYHQQWFAKKSRAGGGHLIWLGIHWLDLAMYVTGSAVERVAGFTANVGGQPLDIEDSAVATLQFDNGTLGTMTSGYYLDSGYHSHIKIWGSEGWLHLEQMRDRPLRWYSTTGGQAGEVQEFDGSKEPRGYTPFVREAVEACARMSDPPISSADSLRALQTVFAVYDSADTGQATEVR